MKILIWTDLALDDYHLNIDYILQEWSEKEALQFIEDVDLVLQVLKSGIVEYKESNYKNVKECVVCRQITLYYRHLTANKIELLRFWNNMMEKKRLNF
jgi:plasmid stabilization system protein ParE